MPEFPRPPLMLMGSMTEVEERLADELLVAQAKRDRQAFALLY